MWKLRKHLLNHWIICFEYGCGCVRFETEPDVRSVHRWNRELPDYKRGGGGVERQELYDIWNDESIKLTPPLESTMSEGDFVTHGDVFETYPVRELALNDIKRSLERKAAKVKLLSAPSVMDAAGVAESLLKLGVGQGFEVLTGLVDGHFRYSCMR